MGAYTSDTCAATTTRVPTSGPGAKGDPLSHNILMGEKESRRCPEAFTTEDPNSPHSHSSQWLRTPVALPVLIPADSCTEPRSRDHPTPSGVLAPTCK